MRTVIVREYMRIPIGRQGENEAAQVVWPDVAETWAKLYGQGTFQLAARRKGDAAPYPVAVTVEGGDVVWTVSNADTAVAGDGSCELSYLVGDAVAKSHTWGTQVSVSLTGDEPTDPPEPETSWVDEVLAAGAAAGEGAAKAAASAEQAEAAAKESAESEQAAETAAKESGKSAENAESASNSAKENAATAQAAAEEIREALKNYFSKPQTLLEQTAALYGLGADATPNDVLSILAGLALPQIKVTAQTGSTVVCTRGSTTLTAVEQDGVWTFRVPAYGTWTVTATKDGLTASESVIVDAVKQYSVSPEYFSANFAENTWAQIAKASAAGIASQLWSVGEEKDITVYGETLTLVIMGFDHDDLASGGKAGITLGLKNLMAATRSMNSSNTNIGGFAGSEMYSWLQDTLLPALPSDLQTVIKSVNKKTSEGNKSSTINTDSMKLFLFSEIEIFGSLTFSCEGEGLQYSYFTAAATRIKRTSNGAGPETWWWGRSPNASAVAYFCSTKSGGTADANYASSSRGVCFGFCV